MSVCNDFSGIVINQNATSSGVYTWDGTAVYQTFSLPADYQRGDIIPDLSGLQVLTQVTFESHLYTTLNYELEYYAGLDAGWQSLTSGTVTGTYADGLVWFDLIFPNPVPISSALLTAQFRFGLTQTGTNISGLAYVTPTPMLGQAYQSNGTTRLVPTTACLNFRLLGLVADSGVNFLNNDYRSAVVVSSAANVGSAEPTYWMSPPQPSRFAVLSLYFDLRTTSDTPVVIDSVLLDPLTPNMAFNVYYTNDDAYTSEQMSETDWEQKLWQRVPEAYLATQRQQYAFPNPITAKYVKVEFTNLQSQSYTPGEFQKPTTYKKFPTWVTNLFVLQMQQPSFVASQVNVAYDALSFMYDYYLDDLNRSPQTPTAPPTSALPQLTSYFSPGNADAGVDPATLAKVNLVLNAYKTPPAANVNASTTLGSYVASLATGTDSPPTTAEGGTLSPVDYSLVSSLQREPLLIEQGLPVMYFFIPCRHTYKELTASFEYNRAYFAGVKQVAFLRNSYTVAADTPLYIETGNDAANIATSDWVVDDDGTWHCY
jgi:hypothetical protein